jgi:hypothetical protein
MNRPATHLVILRSDGMRIECWTDVPELTEAFYRDAGCYVFEGGLPQPIRTERTSR